MTHHQMIDWTRERANFPALKEYVYFMGAANSPLSNAVYDAQRAILDLMHQQAHTSWEGIISAATDLRQRLAQFAGGKAEDWGFGANTSHNMNLLALGLKEKLGPLEVISFEDEFPSSTIAWTYHRHKLIKLASEADGRISFEKIKAAITPATKAVVLSHVQYSTGYKSDLKSIGKFLRDKGIFFIVNATQSFGVHPLNVDESQISALVCSAHKWLGAGYGASLLYTSGEFRKSIHWMMAGTTSFDDPTFKGDFSKPRTGTSFIELGAMPFMQILGIRSSLVEIERIGIENISARTLTLSKALQERLENLGLTFKYSQKSWQESEKSHLLYLNVQNPGQVEKELLAKNILVNNRRGLIRMAIHFANNEEDIKKLSEALTN